MADNLLVKVEKVQPITHKDKHKAAKDRYQNNLAQVNGFGFRINEVNRSELRRSKSSAVLKAKNKDLQRLVQQTKKTQEPAVKPEQAELPPRPPPSFVKLDKNEGKDEKINFYPKQAAEKPLKVPIPAKIFYASFKDQLKDKKQDKDDHYKALYAELKEKENVDRTNLPVSKGEIWQNLALGKAGNDDGKPKKKKRAPRPSSARWAELSNARGMHDTTKVKVEEMRKTH